MEEYSLFRDPAFQDAIDAICEERGCAYINPEEVKKLDIFDAKDLSELLCFKNLEALNIEVGEYKDLNVLKQLTNLRELHLSAIEADDMSAVWELEQVTNFGLDYCCDFPSAVKFMRLKKLLFMGMALSDPALLRGFAEMEELHLYICVLNDIGFVADMKKLKVIDVGYNRVTDISSLAVLGKLEIVSFWGNKIIDLSPLKKLSGIKRLNISGNPIRQALCSLNDLDCIHTLVDLSIHGIPIDSETFSQAKRLKSLHIGGRNCKDISFLTRHKGLEELTLHGSRVRDISCLLDMPDLKSVSMINNELISDYSPAQYLRNKGVAVYINNKEPK